MIYLISNLMKLTRINLQKLILASLGNSIIKRAYTPPDLRDGYAAFCGNKKTSRQIVGTPNL